MKSEATDTDLYAAWCGGYGEGLQTPPIPRRMSDAPRDGKTRILLCNPDQDDGEFIGVGVWGEWSDGTTGWCIDGGSVSV